MLRWRKKLFEGIDFLLVAIKEIILVADESSHGWGVGLVLVN